MDLLQANITNNLTFHSNLLVYNTSDPYSFFYNEHFVMVLAEILEVMCSPSPTSTANDVTLLSNNGNSLSSISHQPSTDSPVTVVPTPMVTMPMSSG